MYSIKSVSANYQKNYNFEGPCDFFENENLALRVTRVRPKLPIFWDWTTELKIYLIHV